MNNRTHNTQDNPVFIIARTLPRYSESWMDRMNGYLLPNAVFIAINATEGEYSGEIEGLKYYVAHKNNGMLVRKFHKFLNVINRKSIVREIEDIIRKERKSPSPVILLCHYLNTADLLYPLWNRADVLGLVHCHGHDVTWDRRAEILPFLPAHGFGYKRRVKQNLIGTVKLISNSNVTTSKLVKIGFSERDIFLKYLGIDLQCITKSSYKRKSELSVLYLGRLTDFKGPIETIRAFSKALELGFSGCLTIAGGGALSKPCERLVNELGISSKVKLLGPVDREYADQLLGQADIFTAHNKWSAKTGQEEGFGVSVIEAMAHGMPVITGASGGVLETVVDDVTGILVEPGDIQAHADALLRLQKYPEILKVMGEEGVERVAKHFSSCEEKKRLDVIIRQALLAHEIGDAKSA